MAVADPELLVLFEDWLDELEDEVISLAQETWDLESRGPGRANSACPGEAQPS